MKYESTGFLESKEQYLELRWTLRGGRASANKLSSLQTGQRVNTANSVIPDHVYGAKRISLIKQVSTSPVEYFVLHIIWLGDGEYIYGLQVASQNPDPISIWDFL